MLRQQVLGFLRVKQRKCRTVSKQALETWVKVNSFIESFLSSRFVLCRNHSKPSGLFKSDSPADLRNLGTAQRSLSGAFFETMVSGPLLQSPFEEVSLDKELSCTSQSFLESGKGFPLPVKPTALWAGISLNDGWSCKLLNVLAICVRCSWIPDALGVAGKSLSH